MEADNDDSAELTEQDDCTLQKPAQGDIVWIKRLLWGVNNG